MAACCGRLFTARTESALDFFELLARARAFDLGAVLVFQSIPIDAVMFI